MKKKPRYLIKTLLCFFLFLLFVNKSAFSDSPPCSPDSFILSEHPNAKCTYSISRLSENEYLMIKNILNVLVNHHWNITLDFLNVILEPISIKCDQYFDYVGVSQVIAKDFKHPNNLFKKLTANQTNQSIKLEYEAEWFQKYKLIKVSLQPVKYFNICNKLGLKLHFLLHDYAQQQAKIFKCSSYSNQEEPVGRLIDYYIAQTFWKNCDGNLEMLANSIYRLLKHDCERAHKFKIAYYNSRYLNLFRACDPDLTVNDLLNSGRFANCTNHVSLNGFLNKKFCSWFQIVCKYPTNCLKSMGWLV
jgi:hypothetical protein